MWGDRHVGFYFLWFFVWLFQCTPLCDLCAFHIHRVARVTHRRWWPLSSPLFSFWKLIVFQRLLAGSQTNWIGYWDREYGDVNYFALVFVLSLAHSVYLMTIQAPPVAFSDPQRVRQLKILKKIPFYGSLGSVWVHVQQLKSTKVSKWWRSAKIDLSFYYKVQNQPLNWLWI